MPIDELIALADNGDIDAMIAIADAFSKKDNASDGDFYIAKDYYTKAALAGNKYAAERTVSVLMALLARTRSAFSNNCLNLVHFINWAVNNNAFKDDETARLNVDLCLYSLQEAAEGYKSDCKYKVPIAITYLCTLMMPWWIKTNQYQDEVILQRFYYWYSNIVGEYCKYLPTDEEDEVMLLKAAFGVAEYYRMENEYVILARSAIENVYNNLHDEQLKQIALNELSKYKKKPFSNDYIYVNR